MPFPGGLKGFLANAKAKKGAVPDEKEPKGVKDSPAEEVGEPTFPPKKGKKVGKKPAFGGK